MDNESFDLKKIKPRILKSASFVGKLYSVIQISSSFEFFLQPIIALQLGKQSFQCLL